ncbi:hypothetical protein FA13DRAFT_1785158 [Coprinellus micaceus]|uniref:TEL2-interacting protein 1 n=1 Tax=Coprinellus micaceus TaxID=71717 RepID=A0A4Y7TYH8_COPMI|nr:hypothetical protein FA13DRAFT_1785158 [Coprinellus micaceus]
MSNEGQPQFQRFKAICVPILGNAKLTPSTIPTVSSLLSQLIQALRGLDSATFTTSFISYVFFPLSSILQRNLSAEIPDQVLEKVLVALGLLCENWWWTCEAKIWEQIFMLCGAVVGGLESKGKERARDEETKEAAIRCLLALLHERTPQDALERLFPEDRARERTQELENFSRSQRFIPIIGQTIDSVLGTAVSTRLPLQRSSLDLLSLLLDKYAPQDLVPTVLPGVASVMTKACLGIGSSKSWTNGEIVACSVESAADRHLEDLEDLAQFATTDLTEPTPPLSNAYGTARTPSWLRGTTSQLHIAINALNPLVRHPTPSALYALVDFSSQIIASTSLTLPQTQPLLLSFLLSLSHSEYPKNLAALAHFISSQSDAKVQHVAEMVIAAIGKLLGPGGGIEKWGWSLLSVLEFIEPPVTVTTTSAEQLMLESTQDISWVPFPDLSLKTVSSREAGQALDEMLRALGGAAGDSALYSIEWFTSGVGKVSLTSEVVLNDVTVRRSKRAEKQSRALARTISELWDKSDLEDLAADAPPRPDGHEDLEINVQHQKGLVPLHETLKIIRSNPTKQIRLINQPVLHRGLCLQLIAIAAGILQSRFDSLFIFSLYPILHSIVSPSPFLSSSGLAALNYVTIATSYASPANLLLSNFDYALDAVSRRLTRRWLDIDATKVLVILVRLVGPEVVAKAGDVVEECFDRLDAFHGYGVIVDGLIEVLTEVLNVIEMDVKANPEAAPHREEDTPLPSVRLKDLNSLFEWLPNRNATPQPEADKAGLWTRSSSQVKYPQLQVKSWRLKSFHGRFTSSLTNHQSSARASSAYWLWQSPVLPESALLPSIHSAWPFILNRFSDHETFVVGAVANLIEVLVTDVGSFMYRRIWDDVWPRFQTILTQLEAGDRGNALARRGRSAVGTESAYTHSHRLYRSIIKTMTGVMKGVHPYEPSFWECLVLFRRFLGEQLHDELKTCARQFYTAAGEKNPDAVWLVLKATTENIGGPVSFMHDDRWKIEADAQEVLLHLNKL